MPVSNGLKSTIELLFLLLLDNISLIFIDDTFPPPDIDIGTSDRLSNIAGRQNIWTVKGSSGSSTLR